MKKPNEINLNLTPRDTELKLRLPNGEVIEISIEVDEPKLRIQLPKSVAMRSYLGQNMLEAPQVPFGEGNHHRLSDLISIELSDDSFEE